MNHKVVENKSTYLVVIKEFDNFNQKITSIIIYSDKNVPTNNYRCDAKS